MMMFLLQFEGHFYHTHPSLDSPCSRQHVQRVSDISQMSKVVIQIDQFKPTLCAMIGNDIFACFLCGYLGHVSVAN